MEGGCSFDHGPREVVINKIEVDKYPVTNLQYYNFIKKTNYMPSENKTFLKHWANNLFFLILKWLAFLGHPTRQQNCFQPNKVTFF